MAGPPVDPVAWPVIWAVYLFGVHNPSARRFGKGKTVRQHIRTPGEEVMMESHFGDAYRVYMKQTSRLVPSRKN